MNNIQSLYIVSFIFLSGFLFLFFIFSLREGLKTKALIVNCQKERLKFKLFKQTIQILQLNKKPKGV